ncbi:MAG: FkbM family methyltransferase [Alphaproteobacteria bacterium]|nr:FkbM family methyltransferase [Alphaproteobacteria bacterium]
MPGDLRFAALQRTQPLSFSAGQALHAFERPLNTVDTHSPGLQRFNPVFRQGSLAVTLDIAVQSGFPVPTHIKIDVDGFEDQVIAGARSLLERRETKSLLIEVNQNMTSHPDNLSYLEELGWRVDDKSEANYIFRH